VRADVEDEDEQDRDQREHDGWNDELQQIVDDAHPVVPFPSNPGARFSGQRDGVRPEERLTAGP